MPLVHLESIAEDLKHCKENSFTSEFCNDIKKEILKLLQIVTQYKFNLEKDCSESNLFANRIKNHKRKRKNILAMCVLRSLELELGDDEDVNSNTTTKILQVFDNNTEDNHISVLNEHRWKEDIGERSRRILE